MEIEIEKKESMNDRDNDAGISQKNVKFLTTDLLQYLTNDKNNELSNSISFEVIKKQKYMMKNLSNFYGLNLSHDNEKFQGLPGDYVRNELKVKKYFIENQDFIFENEKEKFNLIKRQAIENNIKKINKFTNLINLLKSKDFEFNMRNNMEFYEYITYHPYLEFLDKEMIKDFNDKYSSVEMIRFRMKNNTNFKNTEDNTDSQNLHDEDYDDYDNDQGYDDDLFMVNDSFEESGDEVV